MTKRGFGNLEQSILNALRSEKRATVNRVLEKLGGQDKYTTIMTVMNRMAQKGLIQRERVGVRYEYWIQESSETLLGRLKSRLFGFKAADVVSYLVDKADDLSDEDIKEMEKIIEEAKRRKE